MEHMVPPPMTHVESFDLRTGVRSLVPTPLTRQQIVMGPSLPPSSSEIELFVCQRLGIPPRPTRPAGPVGDPEDPECIDDVETGIQFDERAAQRSAHEFNLLDTPN